MAFRITGCEKPFQPSGISSACTSGTRAEHPRRMLKKADQQGRSERRAEAYPLGYVEGLNDARTPLTDFFSILIRACMINRMCASIMVGGVAILWLPLDAAASNCQVETTASGPEVALIRHLSADCTEQEREARAVDAAQLLQAFKEGKGIDLSGVVVQGDLSLDMLPVGPLPPELEGTKELQGREVRVISGSIV